MAQHYIALAIFFACVCIVIYMVGVMFVSVITNPFVIGLGVLLVFLRLWGGGR
ncbi:MAG: hypothetical protein V2B18_19215 [Pseudomonadota bacterium]